MDKRDSELKKKSDQEKADGLDQVTIAAKEPEMTEAERKELASRVASDDGGCTIGETGKIMFWVGLACVAGFICVKLTKKD